MMNNKYIKLIVGIVLDMIGMSSYIIPGLGEISDMYWAPISSFVLLLMYKGIEGKLLGLTNLLEELSPGFDVIPTFTITWVYTYVIKK